MTEPLFNKGDIVKHKHMDIRKQTINVYEDEEGSFSYSVGTEAMYHFYTEDELVSEFDKVEFIKQPS